MSAHLRTGADLVERIAELIIAKHRAGETDTVRLAWMSEFTLFGNLAGNAPGTPIDRPRVDRGDVSL